MKSNVFIRFGFLGIVALSLTIFGLGTTSTQAQEHHQGILTAAEKAQLSKAREAALAADPALKAEGAELHKLKKEQKAGNASLEDRKALKEKFKAHEEKVKAAALKIDPTLQPIFDKMAAAKKAHDAGAATPPPAVPATAPATK